MCSRYKLVLLVLSTPLYSSEEVLNLRSSNSEGLSEDQSSSYASIGEKKCHCVEIEVDLGKTVKDKEYWQRTVLPTLLRLKSDAEFTNYVLQVREELSYAILSDDMLETIKEIFDSAKEDLEKALDVWISINQVKWSCQNKFQAFMGHLFFPVQYDCDLVGSSLLSFSSYFQGLLGLASSYKNLLACHFVGEILETYRETVCDESTQKLKMIPCLVISDKTIELLQDVDLDDSTKKMIKDAAESDPNAGAEPHFYCSYLCRDWNSTFLHDKLGHMQGNIACTFQYGKSLQDDQLEKFIDEIKEKLPGMAMFLSASLEPNWDERLLVYEKAGDQGFIKGYEEVAWAASYWEKDLEKSLTFYLNVAERSKSLGVYNKIAKLALEKKDTDLAKKMYEKIGDLGNDQGYALLGTMLWDEENFEEAKKYYMKAGEFGSHCLLFRIYGKDDQKYYKKRREEILLHSVEKLLIGVFDEKR